MNGYSLIFGVITILAVAVISGAVVWGMMGGLRLLANHPSRRRRLGLASAGRRHNSHHLS